MSHLADPECLINELLRETSPYLSAGTVETVESLVSHREPRVAFEVLSVQLFEENVPLSRETFTLIEAPAASMSYPAENWSFLKDLVN